MYFLYSLTILLLPNLCVVFWLALDTQSCLIFGLFAPACGHLGGRAFRHRKKIISSSLIFFILSFGCVCACVVLFFDDFSDSFVCDVSGLFSVWVWNFFFVFCALCSGLL